MRELLVMAATAAQDTSKGGNPLQQLLLMFGLLALFMWLIVLRPQKKERQNKERKLAAIKKGDRVVTIGGVHGKVSDVDENSNVITVDVAPKVGIKVNRSAIASVEPKGSSDNKQSQGKKGPESKNKK